MRERAAHQAWASGPSVTRALTTPPAVHILALFLTNLLLRWREMQQRRRIERDALELDRAEVARRWGKRS
jgi:hypothetical protein